MDLWYPKFERMEDTQKLREKMGACDLCRLLYQSLPSTEALSTPNVTFYRAKSSFKLGQNGPTILSIYASPGKHICLVLAT